MNEWRDPGILSPSTTAKYESQLMKFMMLPFKEPAVETHSKVDKLSVKMFHKRFDEQYHDKLTTSQKKFLNDVTFLNKEEMQSTISQTKNRVLGMLENHHAKETNNLLKEQYKGVYNNIATLDPTSADAPARQLTLLQLIDELEDEDE